MEIGKTVLTTNGIKAGEDPGSQVYDPKVDAESQPGREPSAGMITTDNYKSTKEREALSEKMRAVRRQGKARPVRTPEGGDPDK